MRRQLTCLPTGTGKTVIFAQFPSFFRMKRRTLILAHREELLNQARDKLLAANSALRVEIEQAGRSARICFRFRDCLNGVVDTNIYVWHVARRGEQLCQEP